MLSFLKKLIFGLVLVGVVIFLTILGVNTYFKWRKYQINEELEKERQEKKAERELQEEQEKAIRTAAADKAGGWNPEGKAKILKAENIEHLGMRSHPSLKCENLVDSEGNTRHPTLIFPEEVNRHLEQILEDIQASKNEGTIRDDGCNDNYSTQLKRNNAVLYGAPGTGKTEFINELVHHLYEIFFNPEIPRLEAEIEAEEQELTEAETIWKNQQRPNVIPSEEPQWQSLQNKRNLLAKKRQELVQLQRDNIIPPVIEVKGAKLQSGGAVVDQPNPEEKLIKAIKHYKQQAFGDPYSNEPYIVFVEEADQGINVMGNSSKAGHMLEEYKNFLSTSEDKEGLRADAQDPNSIIIIATNNFADIDPAVVRRGRLGKKLNFSWNPLLLKKYGEEGGTNAAWPKINWPNDPAWQFTGNPDYEALYTQSAKFGYSMFKDEFAKEKANQIIKSYRELTPELKKAKEKELGYFRTGKKITDDKGKEIEEKVCNWLLHFLYTFHQYNTRQDLASFQRADQIQRYDFGNEFFTREAVWGVYQQLGMTVDAMNVIMNNINDIAGSLRNIKDLMVETQSIQQDMINMKNKINEVEHAVDTVREGINNNIRTVQENISRLAQNISDNASSSSVSLLADRLAILEGKIANLGSSSSESSGGKIRQVGQEIETIQTIFNQLIQELNNSGRASPDTVTKIQSAISNLISAYNNS